MSKGKSEEEFFRVFTTNMSSASQMWITQLTNEAPRALVTDNNEPRPAGRILMSEKRMQEEGRALCNTLMLSLARGKLAWPMERGMKHNDQGLI